VKGGGEWPIYAPFWGATTLKFKMISYPSADLLIFATVNLIKQSTEFVCLLVGSVGSLSIGFCRMIIAKNEVAENN